jgi:hypothetical protein
LVAKLHLAYIIPLRLTIIIPVGGKRPGELRARGGRRKALNGMAARVLVPYYLSPRYYFFHYSWKNESSSQSCNSRPYHLSPSNLVCGRSTDSRMAVWRDHDEIGALPRLRVSRCGCSKVFQPADCVHNNASSSHDGAYLPFLYLLLC